MDRQLLVIQEFHGQHITHPLQTQPTRGEKLHTCLCTFHDLRRKPFCNDNTPLT